MGLWGELVYVVGGGVTVTSVGCAEGIGVTVKFDGIGGLAGPLTGPVTGVDTGGGKVGGVVVGVHTKVPPLGLNGTAHTSAKDVKTVRAIVTQSRKVMVLVLTTCRTARPLIRADTMA